jgi:CHASE2 domain-containing sensor protein
MLAYLVLLVALLSRLLPPILHLTPMNFTAVGGSLLFFGARRPRWQSGVAVAALMVTDYLLTVYAYHYAFHVRGYLVTWAWYAGVCLLGSGLLRKASSLRVIGGVVGSATSFFLLSNLVVWMGHMYPHTIAGLSLCYANALPFYRNDLVSTGLVSAVLFGLPVVASKLVETPKGQGQTA